MDIILDMLDIHYTYRHYHSSPHTVPILYIPFLPLIQRVCTCIEPTSTPPTIKGTRIDWVHCQYRVCVVSTRRCLPFVIFVCFCFGFVWIFSFFLFIFLFYGWHFFLNYYCQDICCLLAGCHHTYFIYLVCPPRSSCDQYNMNRCNITSQKREKRTIMIWSTIYLAVFLLWSTWWINHVI